MACLLGARPLHTDNTAVHAYTIRRFDGDACEFDVDMVVHSHGGVGGMWARSAVEGDVFGFLVFNFPDPVIPACDTLMLIGDETSIPHFACVVEDPTLPPGQKVIMLLEVEDEEEQQSFDTDLDLNVIWAYRKGEAARVPGCCSVRCGTWTGRKVGCTPAAPARARWSTRSAASCDTSEGWPARTSGTRPSTGAATWCTPTGGARAQRHPTRSSCPDEDDPARELAQRDNMMDILEDDLGSSRPSEADAG